jgi:hypothetical protein
VSGPFELRRDDRSASPRMRGESRRRGYDACAIITAASFTLACCWGRPAGFVCAALRYAPAFVMCVLVTTCMGKAYLASAFAVLQVAVAAVTLRCSPVPARAVPPTLALCTESFWPGGRVCRRRQDTDGGSGRPESDEWVQ